MARYSIELDADLVKKLDAVRATEGRTKASMLRCIVARVLNNPHVSISASNQRRNSANMRHFSADSASFQQRPDPARASTQQTPDPEKSLLTKEVPLPEGVDPTAFTVELQEICNAAPGIKGNPWDPAAQRYVIDRLTGRAAAMGAPATVEQVRAVVTHYAGIYTGAQYDVKPVLRSLLGDKFWERHAAVAGLGSRGAAATAADKKRDAERRRQEAENRKAARARPADHEENARRAAEVADSLRKAGPMSTELKLIEDRVAAREETDE